jgi:hypothetical protein
MPSARFLYINKDGNFVLFSHPPSQESRKLTGETRIDDIKTICNVPVLNVK